MPIEISLKKKNDAFLWGKLVQRTSSKITLKNCGHLLKMEVLMKAVTNAERPPDGLVDTASDSAHVSGLLDNPLEHYAGWGAGSLTAMGN